MSAAQIGFATGDGLRPAEARWRPMALWRELGASMRALREAAGLSLRQVEAESGWGRGTLSQVENGKARPSRAIVEWYETHLGADGLLMSLYVEARTGPALEVVPGSGADAGPGCSPRVLAAEPAAGSLVRPGASVPLRWTLENAGATAWHGLRLQRVGAHAGSRIITSARSTPVPDAGPDEAVPVAVDVRVPHVAGTVVAYWLLVDADGRARAARDDLLTCVLVVG